jgi:hypothetical protein
MYPGNALFDIGTVNQTAMMINLALLACGLSFAESQFDELPYTIGSIFAASPLSKLSLIRGFATIYSVSRAMAVKQWYKYLAEKDCSLFISFMMTSMVFSSLRYLCVISDLLDDHLLEAMLNQRLQLANRDTVVEVLSVFAFL